jgi:hypothetical protein
MGWYVVLTRWRWAVETLPRRYIPVLEVLLVLSSSLKVP